MTTYAQERFAQIIADNAARVKAEEERKQRQWSATINPQPVRSYAQVVEDMDDKEKSELDAWWDEMMK